VIQSERVAYQHPDRFNGFRLNPGTRALLVKTHNKGGRGACVVRLVSGSRVNADLRRFRVRAVDTGLAPNALQAYERMARPGLYRPGHAQF